MEQHDPGGDEAVSTDQVLFESVERVRSSRRLIEEIDLRLERSQRLLDEVPADGRV